MVREPVQQGGGHAFALEDLVPVAEREIAGDQQAAAFVAVGEHLEQQLGSGAAERQVAEFIDDQQVNPVELLQQRVQSELLLCFFELVHQSRRCEELRPHAFTAGGQAKCDRQVSLPSAGLAEQTDIGVLSNPVATSEFQHFLFADRRQS